MQIKKKPKNQEKEIRTFNIEKKEYCLFRKLATEWNLNMSEIINNFIKRVNRLLKSEEGGEVVFGIEGSNWEQPKKVVYDGREITERDGVRTYDKKIKQEDNKK